MAFLRGLAAKGLTLALATTCVTGVLAKDSMRMPVAPGSYIVEFADSAADAPAFYSNLTSSKIDASPRVTLSHELFNGASFKLEGSHDNDSTVETIQSMAMVSKIWPVRLYSNPANLISTFNKNTLTLPQRKRDVDTYAPHVLGRVNKLHDEGYTGEGIYIGVVDTGVDYNHPVLGGGFGPGHKVIAGYDLVGDNYDGTNAPIPDSDPMDCNGHGTHVSGIIGANSNSYGFIGVAPNATLGHWRVLGCTGSVGNDVLIAAFNMAYEAGVDLISASIGGSSGWTEDPWDVAVQRITEKGVPCIIAAGNDGANGLFDTSTAGESIGATGVGSIDSTTAPGLLIGATYTTSGNTTKFGYAKGKLGDFGTIDLPLYAPTLDTTVTNDGCSPFPANTPDLSKSVVLIKRGTCAFDVKIANAQAFGAQRVMFYNNVPSVPISPGDTSLTVPVGMVQDTQGAAWIAELKAGGSVKISFTAEKDAEHIFTVAPNVLTGGYMSTFSSWGPSYEGWIKPEISAPGGLILSTLPLAQGGYGVESGTSMATPFISGVIGLIKQIRGKTSLSPDALTSLLATTATPVDFNDGTQTLGYLAPVVQQGGGLVNAYAAAHITTYLSLDNIALNDTSHFVAQHPVIISNTGDKAQTYSFANLIAATAFTLTDGIIPDLFPPNLAADAASGATIRFEPTTLTVGPKSTGNLILHFTRPAGLNAARIPIYSGFVSINGTNGDSLSLPYAGVASKLKDANIVDTVDGYPFLASSSALTASVANSTVFTLPGNSTSTLGNLSLPVLVYELAMGSRVVRVDVVPEHVRGLPRTIGQQVLGSIPGYPFENHPRLAVDTTAVWDGRLADGSWAPEGKYKFMMRALRILGDVTYDHDYERYDSIFFDIKYAK